MIAKNTTVLEGWEEPKDIEVKMKADLEVFPELAEQTLVHKREQIYLMHVDGRSDGFVDYFLKDDLSVSSATMDVMRMSAKICGEQFAKEILMYRSFSLEEVISRITDHLTKSSYERLPEIQKKLDTLLQLEEDLIQMKEFLQKIDSLPVKDESGKEEARKTAELEQQKSILELERKLHAKEAELKAKEMEIASLKTESEMKLSSAKAEYEAKLRYMKLAFDRAMDRQVEKERRAVEKERRALEKERIMNQGGFFHRRNRTPETETKVEAEKLEETEKPDESVEMFLVKVLSENKYREDQLDVITSAVGENLSVEEIRCLCNPGIPASGMKRLKDYFLKRKGGTGYGF